MAILDILRYPDPRLRTRARVVDRVDDRLRTLVGNMFETLYQAPGIGLAATQVNVHERVLVVDISKDQDQPMLFINPEILEKDGVEEMDEGCLSVPGIYERVRRAERIRLKALDLQGESFELEAAGLLAVCIQHEVDHLDGRLFVDYLSQLKQRRIRKKLEKQRRHGEGEASAERHAEPLI